ncbi:flagellar brake protein [Pseudoalteromonas shioyasakiensis]|uniref:flagellar brake domain-containing protein n=1 Tax=Pseudoalteromonas shioyasakiensis TaxID=1190813 RepID=UPI002118BE5F|nr:flagellar brake protein [Pseudoalteromonas shioyasakiensis]MCQ8880068.1 flagellar brake protein [Pseudoalteromonas shioyasakiensis]
MPKTKLQLNLEKLALITAGTIVDVEILTPTDSKRVKTEFVGLLNDRFIVLNYPSVRRLPNAGEYLQDGVVLIIRAVLESGGGQVIAFRQQVMSVASHPAKLIFLNFPKQVQMFSLRSHTRIPTLLPAAIKFSDDREQQGIIKDISATGVMFEIKSKDDLSATKNTQCNILLNKENQGMREFSGEICSVRSLATHVQFGVQLHASEDEMKKFMKDHFIDLSVLEPLV